VSNDLTDDVPGPAAPPTAVFTVSQLDEQITADITAIDDMIDRYQEIPDTRARLRETRADLDGLRSVVRRSLTALQGQARQ